MSRKPTTRDVLSAEGRRTLEPFLCPRTLFAFDLDGTLAPIVAVPAKARLRARTRRLLTRLAAEHPCAIITGRSRASALRLLRGVPLALVIGSHGAEWPGEPVPLRWTRQVRAWHRTLARRLSGVRGLFFEQKPATLCVHFRRSHHRPAALTAIEAALAGLRGARSQLGLLVVNLSPAEAPGKAAALKRAAAALGCARAVYVGDDDGDEEAFVPGGLAVAGVRIGAQRPTRATLRLSDQKRVDDLLRALADQVPTTSATSVRTAARSKGFSMHGRAQSPSGASEAAPLMKTMRSSRPGKRSRTAR